MLRVKSPQDLGAGLLFIFIGLVGIYFGKDLTYGSARSMGPGYFPTWLSWIIIGMGTICLARCVTLNGQPVGKIPLRPILFAFAGVLLFGYLIEHLRLELALIVLAIVVTQSRRQTDMTQWIVIGFCAVIAAAVLFTQFQTFAALKGAGEFILDISKYLTIALFAIVALLNWGERDQRQTLILALCMAFASVVIFVSVLGQAMPTYTGDLVSGFFGKIWSVIQSVRGK